MQSELPPPEDEQYSALELNMAVRRFESLWGRGEERKRIFNFCTIMTNEKLCQASSIALNGLGNVIGILPTRPDEEINRPGDGSRG